MMRYPAVLWQDNDGSVGVHLPAIGGPGGASTHGEGWDHAREMAREVVNLYLQSCHQAGIEPLRPVDSLPEDALRSYVRQYSPGARCSFEWVRPDESIELALVIRQLREKKGWTQQEVANRLGVSQTTYVRWEQPGKFNATLSTLKRLGQVFGRPLIEVRG